MEEDASKQQHENFIIVGIKRKKNYWVSGFCGSYKFKAKVYDKGSKYGIYGGRVSKLKIWGTIDPTKKSGVVNYDCGWEIKPSDEDNSAVFSTILFTLEQLPPLISDNEA